jgi:4-amino-4-deoxy-L-arabinose transferase-like glycosyltransferase
MMSKFHVHLLITALAAILFIPGLGLIQLFDWDELNFAESAREMVVSRNYKYVQIAFEPFWEKPPLFIWIQAFFVNLFGNHTWVYRLPNAIAGIITANLAYHIGSYLGRRTLGVFWAMTVALTFAPLVYYKSGIIDPVFNVLILLSIWHWYRITRCDAEGNRPHGHYLLSGIFIGLAILAKGQTALIVMGGVAFIQTAYRGRWQDIFSPRLFILIGAVITIVGAWLYPLYQQLGPEFIHSFISYQIELVKGQIAWHNQPWFYHLIVLLILCFPAIALAIPYLGQRGEEDFELESWHTVMRIMFWLVLIIFSIVTTKIIHYSSLCWFPLTYFAAYHTYRIHTNRGENLIIQKSLLLLIGLIWTALLLILPLAILNPEKLTSLAKLLDDFSIQQLLSPHPLHWLEKMALFVPGLISILIFMPLSVKNFFTPQLHPGKLILAFGGVGLSVYYFLLPVISHITQDELIHTIHKEIQKNKLVETHGFKSFALYFHGEMQPEDFNGSWMNDTFVVNRIQNQPYPKQWGKRVWIKDGSPTVPARLITKCNYLTDKYFLYQFTPKDTQGAYWVWQRK